MIKKITVQFFDEIFKLDRTITAEHGDGLARSEFIKKQYDEKNYQIFKEIKNLFDPNGIRNPGKIISKKNSIIENLKNFQIFIKFKKTVQKRFINKKLCKKMCQVEILPYF